MKSRVSTKRRSAKQENLPATSFEEQERQLAEKRRKIQQEMEQCREIVKKAPIVKEEQKQKRQKELEHRRASPLPRAGVKLVDPRFGYNAELVVARGPRLRRERSQGRLTFFMLLAALLMVLTWAYFTLSGPAQ